jgi:hypothetical protein
MKKLYSIFILILFATSSFSQEGLNLGGIAFESDKIIIYLDPQMGVLNERGEPAEDGDLISEWIDQGPNAYSFKSTKNSKRPSYTIDNNEAFINFSSGDFLENTKIKKALNGLEEFSIFFEIQSNNDNTDNGFFDTEDPDEKDDLIGLRYDKNGANTGRTQCLKAGLSNNNSNLQVETQSHTQTTSKQIIAMTWKRHERMYVFVNGELSDSTESTHNGVISNIKKIIIGKGAKDTKSNDGWDGKIGSVFFYEEKLDNHIINQTSVTLPVELADFRGDFEENSVILDWSTYSEINNSHFSLERSRDGQNYTTIALLKGAGNSSDITDYNFTDKKARKGYNYYRLVQTDFNGVSETFEPIVVYVPEIKTGDIMSFDVFPNPASQNQALNIKIRSFGTNEYADISIRNLAGKIVYKNQVSSELNHFATTVNFLESGHYILSISSPTESYSIKLIIK